LKVSEIVIAVPVRLMLESKGK